MFIAVVQNLPASMEDTLQSELLSSFHRNCLNQIVIMLYDGASLALTQIFHLRLECIALFGKLYSSTYG